MPQPKFNVEEAAGLQQRSYLHTRLHGVTSHKKVTFMITAVAACGWTLLYHVNKEAFREKLKMLELNKYILFQITNLMHNSFIFQQYICYTDRLCGLVVRVSGYRYRGPGFDSRRYQIF